MTAPASQATAPLWLRAGAPVFAVLLRLLGATWRVRISGINPLDDPGATSPPNKAPIGIAWHQGALVLGHFFRNRNVTLGISRSRDGGSIAAVLRHLGYAEPIRGSSSSGGAEALRQLIARSQAGSPLALLVDGPRGPARRAKPGATAISRRTGTGLTPVGCDARPAIRFGSWDRTLLPLPFARVAIHFGEPLALPQRSSAEPAAELDRALGTAQASAAKSAGRRTPPHSPSKPD